MIIVRELRGELREIGRMDVPEPFDIESGYSFVISEIDHSIVGWLHDYERLGPCDFGHVMVRLHRSAGPYRSATGVMVHNSKEPVAEVISGEEHLDQVEGFVRTANP